MNNMLTAACLLSGMVASAAALAEPLNIEGIGLSRDVSCKGQDVNITGNANVIHLTGECGAVLVYGSEHKVTLESAKSLTVSGAEIEVVADQVNALSVDTSNNEVRTAVIAGEQPAVVTVEGAEHELDLKFDGEAKLSVIGVSQLVHWSGDEPEVQLGGIDNKVERK